MKNEQNLTIGAASKCEVDDVEVGYTEDDFDFEWNSELARFTWGIPKGLVKVAPIEFGFKANFKISEITGPNIALGAFNMVEEAFSAGAQVISGQQRSFVTPNGQDIQVLYLDQPGMPGSYDDVVVTDGSDPYDRGADYLLDAQVGKLYRNPSGDIPLNGQVTLDYGYDRLAGHDIPLGVTTVIKNRKFYFEHIGPDLQKIEVWIWKAIASGTFSLKAAANNWWHIPISLEAQDDRANHPTEPFGRIRITYPVAA